MRISYTAASHVITLAYFDGTSFSTLTQEAIDGTAGAPNWGMLPTDTFSVAVFATNGPNSGATTIPISSGVYADNFVASGTAIPEPSTYATLLGIGTLGFAAYRGRRRRAV